MPGSTMRVPPTHTPGSEATELMHILVHRRGLQLIKGSSLFFLFPPTFLSWGLPFPSYPPVWGTSSFGISRKDNSLPETASPASTVCPRSNPYNKSLINVHTCAMHFHGVDAEEQSFWYPRTAFLWYPCPHCDNG